MIITSKDKQVAFIGHRTIENNNDRLIFDRLTNTISELYEQGCRTFFCGLSVGFDLLACEAILMQKLIKKDIRLIVVSVGDQATQTSQTMDQNSDCDKARIALIVERCDQKEIVATTCQQDRCHCCCDYLVDHCQTLVAYYDGGNDSGTAYAVSRANALNISVINLFN